MKAPRARCIAGHEYAVVGLRPNGNCQACYEAHLAAQKKPAPLRAQRERKPVIAEPPRAPPENVSPDDHFVCRICGHPTPLTEVGRTGKNYKDCKACCANAKSIKDGTWRKVRTYKDGKKKSTATFASFKRGLYKTVSKKYKAGKLPAWMFS